MSIQVKNISKSYAKIKAIDAVSFEVKEGEIFGLIGPDGAGKTTLFRILTTLLIADEGKASVVDYDVVKDYKAIRNSVGYMPGKFSLYQDLTVEENLSFFATIFGTTIEEKLRTNQRYLYVQIEPFKKRRAGASIWGNETEISFVLCIDSRTKSVISRRTDNRS